MYRKFWNTIEKWDKSDQNKMPLIVIGARQVGKTYIIDKYCRDNYVNYCYINLFSDKRLIDWFKNLDTFEKKLEVLKMTYNINLDDENTILFVDEVQESEEFIESLKTFCEQGYTNIICAGSLLGIKLKRFEHSYPVGKVYEEYLYPMDFEEFLIAIGKQRYIDSIKYSFDNNSECLFHEELMEDFKHFLFLGGMPKIIQNYLDCNQKLSNVNNKFIKNIMRSYIEDMNKYNTNSKESLRIERVYQNVPSQLAKENQKFVFAQIDNKDNRKRNYVTALDWLIASNFVLPCYAVSNPIYPLLAFRNDNNFKLFLNDTGILVSMVDIDKIDILMNNDFPFKGVLVENYVACELIKNGFSLNYWSNKNDHSGNAEVDFVIQNGNCIIPIEVKAGTDTRSKSLEVYRNKFHPSFMIRISAKNFGFQNNMKSVPLYAVFCIVKNYGNVDNF